MRAAGLLFGVVALVACTTPTATGPVVTCPGIAVDNQNGECDLVSNSECSDDNFYEIDCGDDATCTCSENGNTVNQPVFVTDQASGFCATLSVNDLNSISQLCGLNLQP